MLLYTKSLSWFDYGIVPDSARFIQVPELPGYGTVPDSAPVHEVPELTNYGAVPDNLHGARSS